MDTPSAEFNNEELSKLNDKDKSELRQFLAGTAQRAQIQKNTHVLAEMCWRKCMTGAVKGPKLDRGEEACLANCVDRFMDMNLMTMKHLENLRQGPGGSIH